MNDTLFITVFGFLAYSFMTLVHNININSIIDKKIAICQPAGVTDGIHK